jgi:polyisoprenoid-binding protein YceI
MSHRLTSPRFAGLFVLAGAFSTPALAQSELPATVDVDKSFVVIFVDKTGFGHQHAVMGAVKEGTLRLGARQEAGRVVFDMASFAADTTEARRYVKLRGETDAKTQKDVTGAMLGKDVLDAKQYPTAMFEIDSAVLASPTDESGSGRYTLKGKFTLHGATKPLEIQADASSKDGGMLVKGEFSFLQTQYGIKPYRAGLGAVGVTDKLTVHGEIYLK